ncbi:MAG: hypothetical protein C5B51_07255 [Terriglobia bacterium]|nr:MAG: hypothetical protein C5B51_07255 [Terriglobia bacterium]
MTLFALLFAAILPTQKLPFSIDASEDAAAEFPGAPHLQAFSFGQWNGKWVFIGGRTAGYHSVGGGSADFLRADSNQDVWVVDTTSQPARTYRAAVSQLPARLAPVKDQWTSTAQLYFQDGPALYIAGGYGQDRAGNWVTFPLISQVDLPSLIDGVMKNQLSGVSIAFARSPLVQSAGGQLMKLPDGYFYVVMGHLFQGNYGAFEGQGEHNGGAVSQTYLNEIRKLRIVRNVEGLSVTLVDTYKDEAAFHRRDLNVTPILGPGGLGLAAYGGVFTPDTQLSYSHPVYLMGSSPAVDLDFDQKMNAYSCAHLLVYEKATQRMFTTFFGGISRHFWDPAAEKFIENARVGSKTESTYLDGLQWSDQISTIRREMGTGRGQTGEFVHAAPLPAFVGADAVFIPASAIPRSLPDTDILALDDLPKGRVLAGYLYGGIRAFPYGFPYTKTAKPYNAGTVPTKVSDLILRVYLSAVSH